MTQARSWSTEISRKPPSALDIHVTLGQIKGFAKRRGMDRLGVMMIHVLL